MDIEITWTFQDVPKTQTQRAISHVRIEARASAELPWAPINEVPYPGTSLTIQDLAAGSWAFRGIVVDEAGEESEPLEGHIDIFERPSPLATLTLKELK